MIGLRIPPALRHRRFFLLWAGLLISLAGSQMQLWSLFWHLRTLSSEPIVVSGIGAARVIPILLFSLVGGLVADQFNRRKVVLITQTVMALVALALALLTFTGTIQIWHIYLLTAVQATAAAFDMPARQSLVPNLVPANDLPNAFSMQSIAANTGAIIGPALSGVVIASFGLQYCYLVNAISFLAVIAAIIAMGKVEQKRVQMPGGSLRAWLSAQGGAVREGFQFIFSRPIILSSMLLDFFASFFSAANTLLPFVAQDILHVGAVEYGWLSAGQSIGAVGAALVISQRLHIRRQGPLLLAAVTIFGLATILFGLSTSFWLTLAALVLVGAGDAVSTVVRNTLRQVNTPDNMRGRMVASTQLFFVGGPQLGEIEAGLVAQAFGTPAAIISGGVGCLVAVGWVAARWPQLRKYDGGDPHAELARA